MIHRLRVIPQPGCGNQSARKSGAAQLRVPYHTREPTASVKLSRHRRVTVTLERTESTVKSSCGIAPGARWVLPPCAVAFTAHVAPCSRVGGWQSAPPVDDGAFLTVVGKIRASSLSPTASAGLREVDDIAHRVGMPQEAVVTRTESIVKAANAGSLR
jgi:hypothetical protein